jgi:hypothetical protein
LLARRRTAFIAVLLVLTVCTLSTVVVSHGHGHMQEEANCPLCHATHVAVPQPDVPVQIQISLLVTGFVPSDQPVQVAAAPGVHHVPRAPPA